MSYTEFQAHVLQRMILTTLSSKVQVILNGCQGDRLWPLYLNSDLQHYIEHILKEL